MGCLYSTNTNTIIQICTKNHQVIETLPLKYFTLNTNPSFYRLLYNRNLGHYNKTLDLYNERYYMNKNKLEYKANYYNIIDSNSLDIFLSTHTHVNNKNELNDREVLLTIYSWMCNMENKYKDNKQINYTYFVIKSCPDGYFNYTFSENYDSIENAEFKY